MHDNPIHPFFQVLSGNIPDQLGLGGFRGFEVVLYWVLLIGSLAIAYTNWRLDSTQRTGTHLSIYAMRLVSAGTWYLSTLWKPPLPISAGFKFWLKNTVQYISFDAHASIFDAHASIGVAQAGRSLGIDNLLAKRLFPGPPSEGLLAYPIAVAS